MFVGVTIKRKKTSTTIREFHEVTSLVGGQNRGMVELARSVANRFSNEWEINCSQLSEHKFKAFVRGFEDEKKKLEKALGMKL